MKPYRVMISADRDAMIRVRPMLKRDGMTVSGLFRKAVNDYMEAKKGREMVINIEEVEALR